MNLIEHHHYRPALERKSGFSREEREKTLLDTLVSQYLVSHVEFPDQVRSILSVACGMGREVVPLLTAFQNAKFTGIDISQPDIQIARRTYKPLGRKVHFLIRDARRSQSFDNKQWDIVVVRNPMTTSGEQNWGAIFENSARALVNDGLFMVTASSGYEADKVAPHLRLNGVEIIDSKISNTPYMRFDSEVMIGRKYAI